MINFIKKITPYVLILGFVGMLAVALGMSGLALVKQDSETGLWFFDLNSYLKNITFGWNNFKSNISEFYNLTLDWSNAINSLKSIGNILISVANTLILPFSIIGNVFNLLMALIGLPNNSTNFLFNIFNSVGSFQIPYIEI